MMQSSREIGTKNLGTRRRTILKTMRGKHIMGYQVLPMMIPMYIESSTHIHHNTKQFSMFRRSHGTKRRNQRQIPFLHETTRNRTNLTLSHLSVLILFSFFPRLYYNHMEAALVTSIAALSVSCCSAGAQFVKKTDMKRFRCGCMDIQFASRVRSSVRSSVETFQGLRSKKKRTPTPEKEEEIQSHEIQVEEPSSTEEV